MNHLLPNGYSWCGWVRSCIGSLHFHRISAHVPAAFHNIDDPLLAGQKEDQVPIFPWWRGRGFKGAIKKTKEIYRYDSREQSYRSVDGSHIRRGGSVINVIHVYLTLDSWHSVLTLLFQDYMEHHENHSVHFVVTMSAKDLEKAEAQGSIEFFKLTAKISASNKICFDFESKVKKYKSLL